MPAWAGVPQAGSPWFPGCRVVGGMAVGVSPRQSSVLSVLAVAAVWSAQPWEAAWGVPACLDLCCLVCQAVFGGVGLGHQCHASPLERGSESVGQSCWEGTREVGWGLPCSGRPTQALPGVWLLLPFAMAVWRVTLRATRVPWPNSTCPRCDPGAVRAAVNAVLLPRACSPPQCHHFTAQL